MTGIDWTQRRPPIQDQYGRPIRDKESIVLCDKQVPDTWLGMPVSRIFCIKEVCHRGRHETATGHQWMTDNEKPIQRPRSWG